MYRHPDAVSGGPNICVILAFLNGCITVKTSLINTKLGDFVNLGVLFLTMWISGCLSRGLRTCAWPFWLVIRQCYCTFLYAVKPVLSGHPWDPH